jgi:hypothetical protein
MWHFLDPGLREYRSEGERRIAQFLESSQIAFEYEKPLAILDGGKTRIWYPDFTLVDAGMILVEYFGVNGSNDYDKGVQRKLEAYQANSLDVIAMFARDFDRDWKGELLGKIYNILRRRMDLFFEAFREGR